MGQSATKYDNEPFKEGDIDEENTNGSSYEEDEDGTDGTPQRRVQNANMLALSTEELQSHLSNYSFMTKHDIRNIAFTEEQCQEDNVVGSKEWYQQQMSTTATATATNNAAEEKEYGKSHMDVALEILKLSPEIKLLRFQLVPAKLSENQFWAAIFYALEYCTADDLGASETLPGATKKNKNKKDTVVIATTDTTTSSVSVPETTLSPPSKSNDDKLMLLVKQKDNELHLLKKQLSQAKSDLTALQKQLSSSSTNKKNKNQKPHKGKWIMSKESQEFLTLDENIKQQLREGKRKRIDEVHEQMKFIMDSDDVKDSQGYWECCGNPVYDSYMLE